MAIQKGDTFGDYQVIDLAGSGGMGTVYKIEHIITKRIEAMKVLPIGIASGPEEIQRFEREIQVQARLHHPHIAALYNAVRDGNSIALIMEYVEGESLQGILERGRLPLHTAVDYASQILDALDYAHRRGVVHRDVSPGNIIITPEGTAKLTDFGLARAVTDLRLTHSGVAVGSPWYMSPEQVRAVEEVDGRSDLYSLGAVLHEMLTARKMFEVDGSFAVMCAQTEVVPAPPSAHNAEVPAALDDVVSKALAKDPAARFPNAGAFRAALDASMRNLGNPAAIQAGRPLLGWRTAVIFAVAFTGLATAIGAARIWRRIERPVAPASAERGAVAAQPIVALPAESQPTPDGGAAAAIPTPEAVVESAPPETRPAAPARRTARPQPNLAIKVSGGVVEPPAPMRPPSAPPQRPAADSDAPVAPADGPAKTESAPVSTVAGVAPAPESVTETAEPGKPVKPGNRFIRALSKLKPFGKGGKNSQGDTAKPAARKN